VIKHHHYKEKTNVHKQPILAALLIMTLVLGLVPAYAQDHSAEEIEHINLVATAYDALFQLDTLQSQTTQDLDQTIDASGISIHQTISQRIHSQIENGEEGFPLAIYSVLEQASSAEAPGVPSQEMILNMEMVFQDGVYLMQVTDMPPEMAAVFPEGWFDPAILSGTGMNFSNLTDLSGRESLSIYPISEETVLRIKELPQEEIDGQAMRVFELVLSPELVMEISGLDSMYDAESLGEGGEEFLAGMIAGLTFSQRVWIGAEDGLPYRIYFKSLMENVELELQGQAMSITQTAETTTDFFGFNEPVEIIEPVTGF
jgi:hypothetical protein